MSLAPYEIIGWLASAGAVAGVVLNNYRLRWCFAVWLCTNAVSGFLHLRGYALGDGAMLSLAARDAVFMLLAVHGWCKWGKKN